MKSLKKIEATLEKGKDGWGAYAEALPGITGFGKSSSDAAHDFMSALDETIASYKPEELPEHLKGNIGVLFVREIEISENS